MAAHAADQEALAAGMPSNENKPLEYGYDNAVEPSEGASADMPSPTAGAGTLSEENVSEKTGPAPLEPVAVRLGIGRGEVRPG